MKICARFNMLHSTGPFKKCFGLKGMDEEEAFKACKMDYCLAEGEKDRQKARCDALSAFAAACMDEFKALKRKRLDLPSWRAKNGCGK